MGPVWIFGYVGLLTVKNEFVLTGIRKVILFAYIQKIKNRN